MIHRTMLTMLALALLGGVVIADGEEDTASPSDEQKLVDELYAKRIAQVTASTDEKDDLALARELLMAANDDSHPAALREVIARTALGLTLELGTDGGVSMSKTAVKTIEGLNALEDVEKARIARDMVTHQFGRQVSQKADRDTLSALAREAIQAHVAYIDAAGGDPDYVTDVAASIDKASRLMRAYRLLEYKPVIEKATERFKTAQALRSRLSSARTRLRAARKSKDPKELNAARSALAHTYLHYTGDIPRAAKYIKDTGHPREKVVLAVAGVLDDRTRLDANNAISQINELLTLSRACQEPARKKIGEAAMLMVKLYLAGDPPALGKSRAKLLTMQIRKLTGSTDDDKAAKKLSAAYKGIAGKVTALEDGRVRLTYDFSNPTQLKDWTTENGKWVVAKGVLACDTGSSSSYGEILNKVKFDSSKPATITFKGTAHQEIRLELQSYRKTSDTSYTTWSFTQSSSSLASYFMGKSWRNTTEALKPGRAYKWTTSLDGKGGYAWKINKTDIHKSTDKASTYYIATNWSLRLRAYRSTSRENLTAFDDVVIEGTPILPATDDEE